MCICGLVVRARSPHNARGLRVVVRQDGLSQQGKVRVLDVRAPVKVHHREAQSHQGHQDKEEY